MGVYVGCLGVRFGDIIVEFMRFYCGENGKIGQVNLKCGGLLG